jgi:DNA topoisomerase I
MSTIAEDLRFGADDEPGIRRTGRKRFRYIDEVSKDAIDDAEVISRITALAVPPAWTDVWISADPCSHIQATGRDARGRKQYRYHAAFRAQQEEAKFELLVPFGNELVSVRRQVADDLELAALSREKVVALVVTLLEETLVRVGNEEYARANGSYGLTTLRDRHARPQRDGRLRLRFTGKSSKLHDVTLDDRRLCRLVRRCQDLPGQLLFQWVDEAGEQHPVRSSDVNEYLRRTSGLPEITAKTFRTWHATVYAAAALAGQGSPTSVTAARRTVNETVKLVAHELNNTPAVCRRSYVHPAVISAYEDGSLPEAWTSFSVRGSQWMSADERRLLAFLEALPRTCG